MNPITRKSMSKLVMQPSFRAVGQTHAEWQTFEKPENKRQMYCGQAKLLTSLCYSHVLPTSHVFRSGYMRWKSVLYFFYKIIR